MWKWDDKIKRVSFCVSKAFEILRNKNNIKKLKKSRRWRDHDDGVLFSVKLPEKTINLFYQATYKWDGDEPTRIEPYFEIEFESGIHITEYVQKIEEILSFLSFSLGICIDPTDISISRISSEEFLRQVERKEMPKEHRVLSLWRPDKGDSGDANIHGSPVHILSEKELRRFEQVFTVWMSRVEEWREANMLMSNCFFRRGEISSERLLLAIRWLEKIPVAKFKRIVHEEHLELMVEAAYKAMSAFDGMVERQRIKGALLSVANESRK